MWSEETKQKFKLINEQNEKHAKNPIPGDYWSEMFSPVCVIIGVFYGNVLLCKTIKEVDMGSWTWDLEKLDVMRLEKFSNWLRYESNKNGFWAHVNPEAHKWVLVGIGM